MAGRQKDLSQEISAAHRPAVEESKARRIARFEGVLGGDKPAQALDQSPQRGDVKRVGAAERMNDLGPGEAAFGVADVMGELDIGGDGAILVLAGDGPHIHAYLNSIYLVLCQGIIYISHAYEFFDFGKCLC